MKNRIYTLLGCLLLLASAVVLAESFLAPSVTLLTTSLHEAETDAKMRRVREVYDINIMLPRTRAAYAATYIPRYYYVERSEADALAKRFGITAEAEAEQERFVYADENGTLIVWMYIDRLEYKAASASHVRAATGESASAYLTADKAAIAGIDVDEAAARASELVRGFGLNAAYQGADVRADVAAADGLYVVRLIPKLGGADNYAFPTTVLLDGQGNLLTLETYLFAYDRLASCQTKTLKAACAELPVDFAPLGTRVDIQKASLVYTFADSIIQPAYMFEGETAGGEAFRCYIPAAVFP